MNERDVVIIGAGPAGLSAAIYAKLDGWSTLVLESAWTGGQGAIAYTVINYPGFLPGDGAVLLENMEKQATSPPPVGVGAELRQEKVTAVDVENMVVTTESDQYRAKAIVLATGSTMQTLGVPGEDRFAGRGVSYYAKRDYEKFGGKKVMVVGGGNTTAKSALLAKGVAGELLMIHRRESLRAYPGMVKRLQAEGIEVWYNTEIKEIRGYSQVESVVLVNNKTGDEREMGMDWVVICVGTEPNTGLSQKAGIGMESRFVRVDQNMMTDKPGVFACGEITGCHRHLVTSASQGASAGMGVSEYLALEQVKRGEMFEGAKEGKYADEYLAMLQH